MHDYICSGAWMNRWSTWTKDEINTCMIMYVSAEIETVEKHCAHQSVCMEGT